MGFVILKRSRCLFYLLAKAESGRQVQQHKLYSCRQSCLVPEFVIRTSIDGTYRLSIICVWSFPRLGCILQVASGPFAGTGGLVSNSGVDCVHREATLHAHVPFMVRFRLLQETLPELGIVNMGL